MSGKQPEITYHSATEAGWVRVKDNSVIGVVWEKPDGTRVVYPPGIYEPTIAVLHMPAFVAADEVTVEVESGIEPLVRK